MSPVAVTSDHNSLIYYVKNNNATKDFNEFETGVERFSKIKFGEIKLEDAKQLQNIFKTNLNNVSKGRFKSEEQRGALENIKLLYDSRQAVLNYLMNILQLHLKLNTKQKMDKVSKD